MNKLEEQIRELFEDLNDQVFRDADYEKGELVTKGQLLHEIVESAKKEFPKWLDVELDVRASYKGKKYPSNKIHLDVLLELRKRRAEWFVRWFMDSADEAKGAEK